jgi:hypothetical protein
MIEVPSWPPKPVIEMPKDLPDLLLAATDDDDDSKSVSTIGSIEEDPFQPSKDVTLRRSN